MEAASGFAFWRKNILHSAHPVSVPQAVQRISYGYVYMDVAIALF